MLTYDLPACSKHTCQEDRPASLSVNDMSSDFAMRDPKSCADKLDISIMCVCANSCSTACKFVASLWQTWESALNLQWMFRVSLNLVSSNVCLSGQECQDVCFQLASYCILCKIVYQMYHFLRSLCWSFAKKCNMIFIYEIPYLLQ